MFADLFSSILKLRCLAEQFEFLINNCVVFHEELEKPLIQCWDAAADFYVACGFRQNTAIRFTDSGWGSEFREKTVFLLMSFS